MYAVQRNRNGRAALGCQASEGGEVITVIAILTGQMADDGDDHASAIMWAGTFLCESAERKIRTRPDTAAATSVGG